MSQAELDRLPEVDVDVTVWAAARLGRLGPAGRLGRLGRAAWRARRSALQRRLRLGHRQLLRPRRPEEDEHRGRDERRRRR